MGVVTNAVLSIVSSIIGGGLVLAGQFFVKRAEDKRVWLIRLQEAASDLATSTGGRRRAASVRRENQMPERPVVAATRPQRAAAGGGPRHPGLALLVTATAQLMVLDRSAPVST